MTELAVINSEKDHDVLLSSRDFNSGNGVKLQHDSTAPIDVSLLKGMSKRKRMLKMKKVLSERIEEAAIETYDMLHRRDSDEFD